MVALLQDGNLLSYPFPLLVLILELLLVQTLDCDYLLRQLVTGQANFSKSSSPEHSAHSIELLSSGRHLLVLFEGHLDQFLEFV